MNSENKLEHTIQKKIPLSLWKQFLIVSAHNGMKPYDYLVKLIEDEVTKLDKPGKYKGTKKA